MSNVWPITRLMTNGALGFDGRRGRREGGLRKGLWHCLVPIGSGKLVLRRV